VKKTEERGGVRENEEAQQNPSSNLNAIERGKRFYQR